MTSGRKKKPTMNSVGKIRYKYGVRALNMYRPKFRLTHNTVSLPAGVTSDYLLIILAQVDLFIGGFIGTLPPAPIKPLRVVKKAIQRSYCLLLPVYQGSTEGKHKNPHCQAVFKK